MEYSQFRFSLRLSKSLLISVFKTLWATFIAALLALFLNPVYTARPSLGVGALFTAVTAKISLASSVQSVSQFGFTDAVLQVVSGFVILSPIAISVRAYRRIERGEDYERVVRRSDLRWAVVLFGSYVAVVLILILVHALLR